MPCSLGRAALLCTVPHCTLRGEAVHPGEQRAVLSCTPASEAVCCSVLHPGEQSDTPGSTALHCTALHSTPGSDAPHCTALQHTTLCPGEQCSAQHYTALLPGELPCTAKPHCKQTKTQVAGLNRARSCNASMLAKAGFRQNCPWDGHCQGHKHQDTAPVPLPLLQMGR